MSKSVNFAAVSAKASRQVRDAFPSLYDDEPATSWADMDDYAQDGEIRSARRAAKEFRVNRRAVREARAYS